MEIANAIQGLPAPPDSFRAFIIPSDSNQTVAGCWYEKPYGWIEIQKSTANSSVSDRNGNYSLKGAQYGIYQGSNLVETLTTDEKAMPNPEILRSAATRSKSFLHLRDTPWIQCL